MFATQEVRLGAYHALHPPGWSEAVRREIREGRALFQVQMLRHGAIAIDATPKSSLTAIAAPSRLRVPDRHWY